MEICVPLNASCAVGERLQVGVPVLLACGGLGCCWCRGGGAEVEDTLLLGNGLLAVVVPSRHKGVGVASRLPVVECGVDHFYCIG